MKDQGILCRWHSGMWLLTGLWLVLFGAMAFGQNQDLYRVNGRVIAQGHNTKPVGDLKLKTYRIEEVRLSEPVEVSINGRRVRVESAYKIIITGEGFPVRDLPGIVWIDDTPVKYAQESTDLTEVTAITYDRALLRNGATLAFSFGENKDSHTELPEKLTMSDNRN